MTLSLYLARRFGVTFAAVGGVFMGLLFLIEMVEQVRRLSGTGAGLAAIAGVAALRVPQGFYQILPLVTILAALTLFLTLSRQSELVVARGAGRSSLRLVAAPALVAFGIGIAALAVLNPIVAATSERMREATARITGREAGQISVSAEGLWLRDAPGGAQVVLHATRAAAGGTALEGVTFLFFAPGGGPVRRVAGARATLGDGVWTVEAARDWDLTAANPEAAAIRHDRLALPTTLTAGSIRESFAAPAAIAIWDLPEFIASLERAGFSARAHRVWLQMELSMPVLLAAMMILGAAFGMRHARAGGAGVMVLGAVLTGFALHFMRNFAQILGDGGQIAIPLAAWSAPVAAMLGALGLVLIMEER